ncbi:MAG TPA: hypothetical protein VFN11_15025 [Ktedonobacterales bacterium]|nr:hypothetical protein [Ktedonobacterales bacterium]
MGWDDDPRRSARNPRMGAPGASSRRNPAPPGLFDPYQPNGSARMPTPGATGRWAAPDQAGWTSTHMVAVPQHHHFSLFHDGNAGHLWRGEVASLLGEAVFTTGTLIWLVGLAGSPLLVALMLASLGIPWLLAGPLAAPLTRVVEPGRGLAWIGRLRFLLALGLIPMHFRTVYPIVFAIIFGIALLGRLREGLRVAAFRVCLAPGEPERVSSDLYIGGAVIAVVGPLLATLAYTLVGERILLVSAFAAVCYLLASNSDGFLDALAPAKRAFFTAQPDEADVAELLERDDGSENLDDPETRRELALPEWYQLAPSTLGQAFAELRGGIALAGGAPISRAALLALCTLGLTGGGLAALEIFFIQDRLGLPGFYLGALLAAEAGGLALGALLGDAVAQRGTGRPAMVVGIIGTGVALAAMTMAPMMLAVLGCALLIGLFNALAVTGARVGLFAGFAGFERRAIGSAETWLVALCGVVGALLFTLFYAGVAGLGNVPSAVARLPFPGWPVGMVLLGAGVSLVVAGVLFAVLSARKQSAEATSAGASAGNFHDYDEDYDAPGDGSAYMSAAMPAADGWDDDQRGDQRGGWDDDGYDDAPPAYGSAQGGRFGGGYGGAAAGRSGSRTPNRRGGLLSGNAGGNAEDADDDSPWRRGGSPGGRRNR